MTDQIKAYFHCKQCLNTLPADMSPAEYAQLEVGWTVKGLQVRCKRHDTNVLNLDFLGQKVATLA